MENCEIFWQYLNKERNGLQVSDICSVDGVSGQDVQSSCAAFHYLLHPHSILHNRVCRADFVNRYKQTVTLEAR